MISAPDLERARSRLLEIIGADIALKRAGREYRGLCCFHDEKTPSFYVAPDKGFFHCFGCGAHGSAIDYIMRRDGLDFLDAVELLLGAPAQPARQAAPRPPAPLDEREPDELLREILAGCEPVGPGTAAYLYLWSRGLVTRERLSAAIMAALLFHPALYCVEVKRKLPALVAPITSSSGEVTAIQRIWVADRFIPGEMPDARAAVATRKMTLGPMGDGAVRLRPAAAWLGLAEGVESGGSAMFLNRGVPVWVTCGTARLGFPAHWRQRHTPAGERPVLWVPPERPPRDTETVWIPERGPSVWIPDEVEHVVIFGDRGETGELVALHAADWYARHERTAEARFPGEEFDDWNTHWRAVTR